MAITSLVRQTRAERGLTQSTVADLAGTSRQTIAAIESGSSVPSVELALRLARALEVSVDELFLLPEGAHAPRAALVVAGSDDPGLSRFAELLRAGPHPLLLSLSPLGSEAGLRSLAAGSADLAGVHLDENLEWARAALRDAALVHFARREQGLVLAPGRTLARLDDLVNQRLALRQRGSGTRALFERLVPRALARHVVAEVSTHEQIAGTVLRGEADAGSALRATAARFGLGFFPLAWERFDLVLRRELLEDARVLALRAALAQRTKRRAVEALGGYDLSDAGRVEVA